MAQRPIFIPDTTGTSLVRTDHVNFQWHAGFAVSQKQKSIMELHEAANAIGISRILEISSKSCDPVGIALSAFNLTFLIAGFKRPISVECAFQGSKVFEKGGPYVDILSKSSRGAKRDQRLQNSGRLQKFKFLGRSWLLEPQTAFYDWLYISALRVRPNLAAALDQYDAFTDIEFNENKSINCQAYSAALYISLRRRGQLDEATDTPDAFLEFLRSYKVNNAQQDDAAQGRLL